MIVGVRGQHDQRRRIRRLAAQFLALSAVLALPSPASSSSLAIQASTRVLSISTSMSQGCGQQRVFFAEYKHAQIVKHLVGMIGILIRKGTLLNAFSVKSRSTAGWQHVMKSFPRLFFLSFTWQPQ